LNRRWLPPLAWAGVILLASSLPGSTIPRELTRYDKVAHVILYGIFAVLLTRSNGDVTGRWRAVFVAVVIAAAFGAVDEWFQGLIAGRISAVADWQADFLGAVGGALLFVFFSRTRPLRPLTR
jgi:VanZ family protein